jgi:hypothetical protein
MSYIHQSDNEDVIKRHRLVDRARFAVAVFVTPELQVATDQPDVSCWRSNTRSVQQRNIRVQPLQHST